MKCLMILFIYVLFLDLSYGADICGSKGLKKFINTIYLPRTHTQKATVDVAEVFRFARNFLETLPLIENHFKKFDQVNELKWQNATQISYDREILIKNETLGNAIKSCKDINMTVFSPRNLHELYEVRNLVAERGFLNFTFVALINGKYLFGMGTLNMLFHNPNATASVTEGLVLFDVEKNKVKYGSESDKNFTSVVCARETGAISPPEKGYVSPWINLINEFLEIGIELRIIFPLAWTKLEQYPTTISPPADYVWSSSLHLSRTQHTIKKLVFNKDVSQRDFDDVISAISDLRKLHLAFKQFMDHEPARLTLNMPNDDNIEEVDFHVEQRSGHLLVGSYTSTKWYPGSLYHVLPYRTYSDLRPADNYYILSKIPDFDQMISKDGLTCDNLIGPLPKCQLDYSSILHKSCSDYYKYKNVNTYNCELERNTGPLISVTDCNGEENVLISTSNDGIIDVRCMDGSSELAINAGTSFISTMCSMTLDGILIHPTRRNALVSKTRIVKQEPIDFKLDLSFEQQLLQKKLLYVGIPILLGFVFVIALVALKEYLSKKLSKALDRFRRSGSDSSANEPELRPVNNPISVIVNNMVPPSNVQSPVGDMPRLRQI